MSEKADRLREWFRQADAPRIAESIGLEIETSFVDDRGNPITLDQSQSIFAQLLHRGWRVKSARGALLTELTSPLGDRLLYDLGRQNLETATVPGSRGFVLDRANDCLEDLYKTGCHIGAFPFFGPIVETDEDLLVIPDERDATWVTLDGRTALNKLAHTSAVQVSVAVPLTEAITTINRLWAAAKIFAVDYPQDALWRQYIAESAANYRLDRYAGPHGFADFGDYCEQLARHAVVFGSQLVPHDQAGEYDVDLFLRSVWWWFRLRRHGDRLCIEVRPMPRRSDDLIVHQLDTVLQIVGT